jgi:hypothetical protein
VVDDDGDEAVAADPDERVGREDRAGLLGPRRGAEPEAEDEPAARERRGAQEAAAAEVQDLISPPP